MSNALELAMDTLDSDASSDRKEKARATIREMVTPQRDPRDGFSLRGVDLGPGPGNWSESSARILAEMKRRGIDPDALPQTHETEGESQ